VQTFVLLLPSMAILIRLLLPTEAHVLQNVAPDVFDNPIDPRWTAEFFVDPRHHIVVALDGATVVGMATGVHYVHPDKAPELFVNEVGVAPPYRRQGLGRQLMEALLAHGQGLGCTGAWLGTEDDNVAARRLYQSIGGRQDDEPFVLYWFAEKPTDE
jgi:ribosomal protein S18 acetylase RimI-like enzyme